MKPKHEMIRVVRTTCGKVAVDSTGRAEGRGAYLTRSSEVIEKAKKRRALQSHLRCAVPDMVYDEVQRTAQKG